MNVTGKASLPFRGASKSKFLSVPANGAVNKILKIGPSTAVTAVKKLKLRQLLALVILCSAKTALAVEVLYAITFDDELLTINSATGAGTLVGALDTSMLGLGLGTRAGKLYTFDQQADRVRELSPTTADTLNTYDVGIATIGEGGLGFRSDGIGFLASLAAGGLHTFDITLGTSAPFAAGATRPFMDGLDFNSSDVLYGISDVTLALYTINQITGATTLVGDTGFDSTSRLSGLAFRSDDVLFGVINDNLYTINTGSGAATLVGAIGYDRVSGLTFVPESRATFGLLGLAAMGLAGFRRRWARA